MAVQKPLFFLCVVLLIAVLGTPVTIKKNTRFKISRNNTLGNSTLKDVVSTPKVIAALGTSATIKQNNSSRVPTNDTLENSTLKAEESTHEGNIPRNNLPPAAASSGVCGETRSPLIYTENFILENDKKSQVLATMTIGISGSPNITCVSVISRSHDEVRPMILSGGVGSNFVEVGIKPGYGNGFDFTVQLFGSYNIQLTDAISASSPTNATESTSATSATVNANNTTVAVKKDV